MCSFIQPKNRVVILVFIFFLTFLTSSQSPSPISSAFVMAPFLSVPTATALIQITVLVVNTATIFPFLIFPLSFHFSQHHHDRLYKVWICLFYTLAKDLSLSPYCSFLRYWRPFVLRLYFSCLTSSFSTQSTDYPQAIVYGCGVREGNIHSLSLEQQCPLEHSTVVEIVLYTHCSIREPLDTWSYLLSTWNVASMTENLNF